MEGRCVWRTKQGHALGIRPIWTKAIANRQSRSRKTNSLSHGIAHTTKDCNRCVVGVKREYIESHRVQPNSVFITHEASKHIYDMMDTLARQGYNRENLTPETVKQFWAAHPVLANYMPHQVSPLSRSYNIRNTSPHQPQRQMRHRRRLNNKTNNTEQTTTPITYPKVRWSQSGVCHSSTTPTLTLVPTYRKFTTPMMSNTNCRKTACPWRTHLREGRVAMLLIGSLTESFNSSTNRTPASFLNTFKIFTIDSPSSTTCTTASSTARRTCGGETGATTRTSCSC